MNVIVMLGVVALIGNARASDQYSEWYPEEAYAGDYGMVSGLA